MSINQNPTNRIKPTRLREQKTEALLVFIRTILEQYFKDIYKKEEPLIVYYDTIIKQIEVSLLQGQNFINKSPYRLYNAILYKYKRGHLINAKY